MATFIRYALSLLAIGQGLAGILGGVIGFVWVGWVGLLAGLPLLLIFLWLLPRALDAWPDAPAHLVAAGLSAGIWGVAVLMVGALAAVTNNIGPDVQRSDAFWGWPSTRSPAASLASWKGGPGACHIRPDVTTVMIERRTRQPWCRRTSRPRLSQL